MSCIITYNGQNFTQEDFLDYLKSQIPASNIQQNNIDKIDNSEMIKQFNFNNSEQLLKSVINHPEIPTYLKDLARQLLDKGNIRDVNIETYIPNSPNTNGRYNLKQNSVYINISKFRTIQDLNTERLAETIVHEYIHAATTKGIRELQAGLNNNIHLKNIQSLFEDYRKDLIKEEGYNVFINYLERVKSGERFSEEERLEGKRLQDKYYAAYKVEEFITMGLSNPTTRETLKSKNLLQKLFDSIASFLGLDNNMFTLLEQEYDKYLDSVNNNKQSLQEQSTPISQQNQSSQFVYKDIAISTQFQLGEQQEEALKQIIDFIEGNSERANEPFFTLQGFAGTGKTTVIGYVQKYFEAKKSRLAFRYVAPTHAATAQLAVTTSRLGNTMLPSTVRSSVFEKKDLATGVVSYLITKKMKLGDFDTPVFIVDETSMMPQKDLNVLVKAVQARGGKIVFMGDNKQIPEVIAGSNQSKTMNSAFQTDNTIILDKVYRQSTSDLLDTLTDIRNKNYFEPSINPTKNDGSLQNLSISEYNNSVIQDFQNDLENTVYIAYTNLAVSEFNKSIKSVLNGKKEPIIGEKIVGYLGYGTKQIENREIANSISYVIQDIKRVSPELSIFKIEAFSNLLGDLKKLGLKGVTGEAYAQYVQLSSEDSFQFDGTTKEQMDETNKFISAKLSKLYKEHLEILARPNHGSKWAALEINKANIADVFSKYQLGNTYVFNPETEMLVLKHLMDPNKYTKILKDTFTVEKGIDYGYGITAHKAQGMTVNNAYVDIENISRYGTETPIMIKGEQVNTEKNALYYVAMSRAKNKVVVKKGASDVQKQNTVPQKETVTIKPQTSEYISNKTTSSLDKYGYVDVLDKNNTDFKLALIKYIVKQLDPSVKTDEQVNAYITKEKKEGRPFDLKKYVNLEEMGDKTRVKLNLSGIIQDEVEGPISLGGLNFTSSGQDNNAQDVFKNNINEAFNCK